MVDLQRSSPTNAEHFTPLARTASITASSCFNRFLWLALRVTDNFHGVFLSIVILDLLQVWFDGRVDAP